MCASIHSSLWPRAIVAREQIPCGKKWKTYENWKSADDLWGSCMRQHVRPALPWRWLARCNTPVNHGSKPLLAEAFWRTEVRIQNVPGLSADWRVTTRRETLDMLWLSINWVVLPKLTVATLVPDSWLSSDISDMSTVTNSEKKGQPSVRRTNICKDSAGFCGLIDSPFLSMGNKRFDLNNTVSCQKK